MKNIKDDKEYRRVVIKPSIAKALLKLGYTIIDLKPYKTPDGYIDTTRSIFIFKFEDGLDDIIDKLKEQ